MKFSISRDEFLAKLGIVCASVPSKSPLAILTGIKMTVSNETLTMVASDSRTSVRVRVGVAEYNDGETLVGGSVVAPGKMLYNIVRTLSASTLRIATEGTQMTIKADRGVYNLNTMDARDYPNVEFDSDNANASAFSIKAETVNGLVKGVMHAASTSEKKPILTGVHLECKDGVLKAIATDSFRLAKRETKVEGTNDFSITIPQASLNMLLNNMKIDDMLEFKIIPSRLFVRTESVDFVTVLLDGNYPDTSKLTNIEFKTRFGFNKSELIGALDRAIILSPSDSGRDREITGNIVSFKNIDGKNVRLHVSNASVGEANEVVSLTDDNEDTIDFSVSGKYLTDALDAVSGEKVWLNYNGGIMPFTLTTDTDPDSIQLLLPVRM